MLIVVCFVYLFVALFSLGCTSMLSLIIFMEIMSWLFVVMLPKNFCFNYLVVQTYFLIISLMSMLYLYFFMVISLLIKMGLPPFHLWFIRMTYMVSKNIFIFTMTFHKLIPLLFLSKVLLSCFTFSYLTFSLIMIGFLLAVSSSLFYTLFFSSLLHSLWISMSILVSKSFFFLYWMLYSSLLVMFISLMSLIKMNQSFLEKSLFMSKCWLFLSGMPPFMMFWIKVYAISAFVFSLGFSLSILFLIMSVIALTSYYRAWHLSSLLESSILFNYALSPFVMVLMFWTLFY